MPAPTRPAILFDFGGLTARCESGSVEYSMGSISGRAQIKFPGDTRPAFPLFPTVDVNQLCVIYAGYLVDGDTSLVRKTVLFYGYIEDDGSAYSGTALENTLSLGDHLRLTQFAIGDPIFDQAPFDSVASYDGTGDTFDNGPWTDISMVQDLLTRSGIGRFLVNIGGRDVPMVTTLGAQLKNSEAPSDLIARVDQATGCKTFSTPTGPKRIITDYTPGTIARWHLIEGYAGFDELGTPIADPSAFAILDISNTRSMKKFFNRSVVKGSSPGPRSKIVSIRQAPPNLPAVAGGSPDLALPFGRPTTNPITSVFSSDLIQTQELADAMSAQQMTIGNRIERRISVTTDFNPLAEPGQTVSLLAPHAKIYDATGGYAWGVKHTWDSGGIWTTWDVAIYDGAAGDLTLVVGSSFDFGESVGDPSPSIQTPVLDTVTSAPDTIITIDASQTQSPGFATTDLTFAWSNAYGDTGTDPIFSFTLTPVQVAAAPVPLYVTLIVTDPLGQSVNVSVPVWFT